MTSPSPFASTAFQTLAPLLGSAPEVAAVFALGYDIDRFEAEIIEFASATGIPVTELWELAADARQGSDPAAPVRPGQHVVSRALLVSWCTGNRKRDQRIWPYSLELGPLRPMSPSDVAKVERFVRIDSERTEMLWGTVETKLKQAVADIEAGTGLANPACIGTIKQAIALHYARSIEMLEAVERTFSPFVVAQKAAFLSDHASLDRLYEMKTRDAAGLQTEDARAAFVNAFFSRLEQLYASGTYFRFRVCYYFHTVSRLIDHLSLQVLRAPPGSEFLIGDVPVITSNATGDQRGVRNHVPIGDAATVVMPLSPRITVALDPVEADFTVDAAYVRRLNTWQVEAARYQVFTPPWSTSLMAWVTSLRPPTAPAAR